MIMLIMFSVVTIVFEQKEKKGTSPCASGDGWVSGMEWFACTVFTAEIVARFAITNSARTLIRDPYMWFDILAVLPCWLIPTASLIPGGTALCGGLSHLKSLRMFRLLKLARKYEGSIVIVRAMKLSLPALTVAIFFLMISVTVFATFLFFTESLNREGAYGSARQRYPTTPPQAASIWRGRRLKDERLLSLCTRRDARLHLSHPADAPTVYRRRVRLRPSLRPISCPRTTSRVLPTMRSTTFILDTLILSTIAI